VLTIVFGKEIVDEAKKLVHSHPWLLGLIVLVVAAVIYLLFRLLRQPAKEIAEEIRHDEAQQE